MEHDDALLPPHQRLQRLSSEQQLCIDRAAGGAEPFDVLEEGW